jgi:TatD DNase family protein
MLIDSHCHLNYPGLVEDEGGVLDRARGRGVRGFLNISTRQSEWAQVVGAAERHADVWASIGVHPHEADAHPDLGTAAVVEAAAHPKVVAIGECGLDYFYDKSDRDSQKARFRAQIAAAREAGLPLIIHTRDAEEDTAAILSEEVAKGGVRGVLHCFTGTQWLADRGLEIGFFISLSGIVTFKNAAALQEVAKTIPQDRLLVETDAPFLAPVPNRGKTCEPAYVADTAAFLADLRGEPLDELAAATSANFHRLFDKAQAQA